MNIKGLDSFWKRVRDGSRTLAEGFDYREGDYLAERIARLEKDVETIKAALPSTISSDRARGS